MTARAWRVSLARARRRVHVILDNVSASDSVAALVHWLLIAVVLASVTAVVLESVPELLVSHGPLFQFVEIVAVTIFSVEYALRVWSAPDHTVYASLHPWLARLKFLFTPSAIVDLVSIAPICLELFVPSDLKILILLRLARFFKLARYSPGMRSLVAVIAAERKALGATMVLLLGLVLVSASAIHLAEHDAQPGKFESIPAAMWWAIVTLTTVGYGDVVPITLAGRIIASLTMIMGIMTLALPIGIIATAFAEEIHRREFVVTWSMIAGVPLFKSLAASEIADIMRCLRAQTVPAETLIVRRGEVAQSMYFIASGEVEIDLEAAPVRLGQGQFFGEMALLHKIRRTATVRATRSTKLLVLDAGDFQSLIERNESIGRHIQEVARQRSDSQAPAPAHATNEK